MANEERVTRAESHRMLLARAEMAAVLVGGISRSLAIGTFCQAFRIQRRPEHWLEAKTAQFRALLNDPITHDEASGLAAAVEGKVLTRDLLIWLRDPSASWDDFDARRRAEVAAEQAKWREEADAAWTLRQDEAWARTRFLSRAKPCNLCGAPPTDLHWTWESHAVPPMCLAAGWATYCSACAKRIDFFVVLKS